MSNNDDRPLTALHKNSAYIERYLPLSAHSNQEDKPDRMSKKSKIIMIIPALNEETNIGFVVGQMKNVLGNDGEALLDEIIVVDNGSTDNTAQIASQAGATVVPEAKRGYGIACLTGIAHARKFNPDVIIFADGDGACHPDDVPKVLAPIEQQKAELVIGKRTVNIEPGALTIPQRIGNKIATGMIFALYKHVVSDIGPFRAIQWKSLLELDMCDISYGWTVEMQVKAIKKKQTIVEVPVRHLKRRSGQSKVSGTIMGVIGAARLMTYTIWKYR